MLGKDEGKIWIQEVSSDLEMKLSRWKKEVVHKKHVINSFGLIITTMKLFASQTNQYAFHFMS